MTHCSRIQNPIGQLQTVTKISTGTFVITRHMCNICIYLLVTIIFAVVACMIIFPIKTYLLSPFIIIIWWCWTLWNYVIFRSKAKIFLRYTFCTSVFRITSRMSFLFFLSDLFEIFFWGNVCTSTNSALFLDKICFLTISTTTWAAVKV